MSPTARTAGNHLLAVLTEEVYQRLKPALEIVPLPQRQILYHPGEPMTEAYFPHQGMVSLVAVMAEEAKIDVGLIGSEGLVGLSPLLGDEITAYECIVQVEGNASRISMERLKAEWNRQGELQKLLLCYVQARLLQVSQWAACNRLHTLEERFAHWLLSVQDCVGTDHFCLTQEFIAEMLGTRRSGVTVAAGVLRQAGILDYQRGEITIRDRQGLAAVACECYKVTQRNFERLLGFTP